MAACFVVVVVHRFIGPWYSGGIGQQLYEYWEPPPPPQEERKESLAQVYAWMKKHNPAKLAQWEAELVADVERRKLTLKRGPQ